MPERLIQFKCSCGDIYLTREGLHNHLRTYTDHEGAVIIPIPPTLMQDRKKEPPE